jgi:hypothetical protein
MVIAARSYMESNLHCHHSLMVQEQELAQELATACFFSTPPPQWLCMAVREPYLLQSVVPGPHAGLPRQRSAFG